MMLTVIQKMVMVIKDGHGEKQDDHVTIVMMNMMILVIKMSVIWMVKIMTKDMITSEVNKIDIVAKIDMIMS